VSCTQDGYAVVSADGPGDYEVAFEALAGTAQQALEPGTVAYIGTGVRADRKAGEEGVRMSPAAVSCLVYSAFIPSVGPEVLASSLLLDPRCLSQNTRYFNFRVFFPMFEGCLSL
jgi:hypothetical protein